MGFSSLFFFFFFFHFDNAQTYLRSGEVGPFHRLHICGRFQSTNRNTMRKRRLLVVLAMPGAKSVSTFAQELAKPRHRGTELHCCNRLFVSNLQRRSCRLWTRWQRPQGRRIGLQFRHKRNADIQRYLRFVVEHFRRDKGMMLQTIPRGKCSEPG